MYSIKMQPAGTVSVCWVARGRRFVSAASVDLCFIRFLLALICLVAHQFFLTFVEFAPELCLFFAVFQSIFFAVFICE